MLGFNVYRATTSGGPYAKITPSPISSAGYVDSGVTGGQTYYYATTAVNTSNMESDYSNIAVAVIPSP
jgi:fibronectin type 3 domain-containing protein